MVWVAAAPAATQPLDRIDRAAHWIADVDRHRPGSFDQSAVEIATWSIPDLQTLWVDLSVLTRLMQDPAEATFVVKPENETKSRRVSYAPNDLRRLRALARSVRDRRDPLDLLRRGALLHTDIATNVTIVPQAVGSAGADAPERLTLRVGDGRGLDFGQTAIHWETAYLLLDAVRAAELAADRATGAAADPMPRSWYRATAAWMALNAHRDLRHVARGLKLYPDDPSLLFFAGGLHEALAAPEIQAAVQSAEVPAGYSVAVGSARGELREAERFLRRSVTAQPGFAEARLHLGRVLDLLGDHQAAAAELDRASPALDADELRYLGDLFVGAAHEQAGEYDAARKAYERASNRFADAQAPWLALGELGRRRGDRAAAQAALAHVFASKADEHDDPWWRYFVSAGRDAGALMADLQRPFISRESR